MKKISSIILCAAMAFCLTACQTSTNDYEKSNVSNTEQLNSSIGGNSGENTGEKLDNSVEKSGDLKLIYMGDLAFYFGLPTNYFYENSTNDGFYLTSYSVSKGFEHLTYIDYASRQEVVLCTDSSCKHDNEKCAAALSGDEFFGEPGLFVYGDHLYLLNADRDKEGTLSAGVWHAPGYEPPVETRKCSLYRMHLDGTGREKLIEFEAGVSVESLAIGDGNSIWLITKTPYIHTADNGAIYHTSKNRALVKFDLAARQITERIPLEEVNGARLDLLGVYKDKFIFNSLVYPDGKSVEDLMDILAPSSTVGDMSNHKQWTDLMNNSNWVFSSLDRGNKTINEICKIGYMETEGFFINENQLYIKLSKGGSKRVDLDSGEIEINNPHEGYMFYKFIAGREVYRPVGSSSPLHFSDPKTGELTECDAWYNYNFISNNDNFAFIMKCFGGPGGDRKFGIISLDDIFNVRENIEYISMVGA